MIIFPYFVQKLFCLCSNQTFTVSGDDLSGNATVTAPTNYEISLSSSSGFSQSVSLVQSGGNITGEPKTIYIRLKSSLLDLSPFLALSNAKFIDSVTGPYVKSGGIFAVSLSS